MNRRRENRDVNVLEVGLVCVLLISCLRNIKADASKCDTCKDLTRRFKEGIENTANSNFGGGNTRWEEKNLGSFTFSETRLIEILEYSCQDGTKECHYMLEENEEILEHWWFKLFAKGQEEDLNKYLCQNKLKVCCPEGTFGPDCNECPTGKERPCSGNGRCQGSGTREGSGACSCNPGYQGEICNECSTSRYFEEVKNDTHTICTACHFSCLTSCKGAGASLCDDCISGWSFVEGQGCVECNLACNGCTGSDPENCIECREKYFHDGTACKACHKSCARNCSDDSSRSCDECISGWRRVDDQAECEDVDECADGSHNCAAESYCLNTEGSFSCPQCDRTCEGCTGPSNKDCKDCRAGYSRNEENECHDIDECHAVEEICSGPGEHCINTLGSFSCECQEGFVRLSGKCVVRRKGHKTKKQRTKEENKLPKISPENLASEIKKMGDPVQGVKLNDFNEDMVMMGGNFETQKQNPSDHDAARDFSENAKKHDDL